MKVDFHGKAGKCHSLLGPDGDKASKKFILGWLKRQCRGLTAAKTARKVTVEGQQPHLLKQRKKRETEAEESPLILSDYSFAAESFHFH